MIDEEPRYLLEIKNSKVTLNGKEIKSRPAKWALCAAALLVFVIVAVVFVAITYFLLDYVLYAVAFAIAVFWAVFVFMVLVHAGLRVFGRRGLLIRTWDGDNLTISGVHWKGAFDRQPDISMP